MLRTTQLEKMVQFYCDVLHCSIERLQPEINLTQLRAGNNIIDLVEVDQPLMPENRNLEHFCLRITPFNFDDLNTYFKQRGVTVVRYGQRYNAQGYGWSFYLRDPEDNEIELTEALVK